MLEGPFLTVCELTKIKRYFYHSIAKVIAKRSLTSHLIFLYSIQRSILVFSIIYSYHTHLSYYIKLRMAGIE